jgi:signal transduction histidine kinase
MSENVRSVFLPLPGVQSGGQLPGGGRIDEFKLGGEGTVRVLSSPIRNRNGQIVGVLQIGQSKAGVERALGALRLRLLMLGGVGIVVAGVSGWVIADRGLRPLSLISKRAKDFADRRDFSSRLEIKGRHDEVGELASTVDELLRTIEETLTRHREFLADTSHELRNPLLAIRTNLELLDRMSLDESRQECVQEATEQVERMSRLVSELLLLARAETNQIIDRKPVPLGPLLDHVISQSSKRGTGQTLESYLRDDAVVLGDRERLGQIFVNLLDNALRYTPAPGKITLSLRKEDSWAIVDVQDSGIGISPEDLPKVFDRFYRVSGRNQEGAGLGLAIVKHLSEAHGGKVTVQSSPGQGSRFTVELPIMAPSSAGDRGEL